MAPPPTAQSTSNSGIRKLSNGDSIIPASTRADGSVRKEIRVKPGYKPPEDVEVYKNRTAQAWKSRGKGGVPGAQAASEEPKEAPHVAAAKNAKRREARKKAAAAGGEENDGTTGANEANGQTNGSASKTNGGADEESKSEETLEAEKTKEARKLAKKLRQARELKGKNEGAEGMLPEQFAKVIKINELIRQLDNLGFNSEGEEKDPSSTKEAAG